jgi:general secretion pathway protein J
MKHRTHAGFTLVEVLVALLVMAVMAAVAWQGIDGIARARSTSEGHVDRTLRLNSVIAQWEQDLEALHDTRLVPALRFDGSSLRLTRRSERGVLVVVWSLRETGWLRWTSPPASTASALQDHWLQALQLQAGDAGQLRAVEGVSRWQLYYYRGNAWTNAQSSADAAGTETQVRELLPAGVRLVLSFAPGSGFDGALTRDVHLAVQP